MDVMENLVELIGSTEYGNGSLVGNNFQKGFIEKIASHLIDHGVTVQEWIPVAERLPWNDDFSLVIVSGKAGNITLDNAIELAQFSMDEGWILEMWPEWEDPKVTYWMPLPKPPKGE